MNTKNLTSPRYRSTIDLEAFNGIDARFIRMGIIKLSPGQWLSHGKDKCRFVRLSTSGDLWVTYGKQSTTGFSAVCKKWLA